MIAWCGRVLGHLRALRRLAAGDLPEEAKRRIRRTYLRLAVFGAPDRTAQPANVAGFRVGFLKPASLLYFFREIFVERTYDFRSERPRPFIIDCGSNIGLSVLYFKMMYPEAEILAFEPEPQAFARLEENIRANGLEGVRAEAVALCGSEGTVPLYVDPDEPGSLMASLHPGRLGGTAREVAAARLSSRIDREVDFLKLDVEGAERAILEDLSETGKLAHIRQMVVEYHHHIPGADSALSPVLRLLEEAGFDYQLDSRWPRPLGGARYQDVLIYAYRPADQAPDQG